MKHRITVDLPNSVRLAFDLFIVKVGELFSAEAYGGVVPPGATDPPADNQWLVTRQLTEAEALQHGCADLFWRIFDNIQSGEYRIPENKPDARKACVMKAAKDFMDKNATLLTRLSVGPETPLSELRKLPPLPPEVARDRAIDSIQQSLAAEGINISREEIEYSLSSTGAATSSVASDEAVDAAMKRITRDHADLIHDLAEGISPELLDPSDPDYTLAMERLEEFRASGEPAIYIEGWKTTQHPRKPRFKAGDEVVYFDNEYYAHFNVIPANTPDTGYVRFGAYKSPICIHRVFDPESAWLAAELDSLEEDILDQLDRLQTRLENYRGVRQEIQSRLSRHNHEKQQL